MPCEPCPPCEPNFPLFCDPLPTTNNAQRIVVEDEASCQKTLTKTSTPALLHQTTAGNIQFSDGGDAQLIKLPQMAKHQASDAPKIVVLLADGTMKAWEPTNSLDNFIAYWDGVSWKIGPFASLFPSGDGVLVKNTLGGFSFVNGVAGESLQYVGANIEFSTQSFATVPTGLILPYAANAPIVLPTGYLECDGSAVSQTTYTNLFSIITTTYNDGTEPSGDFRLPDLRGYFIRGFGTNIDLTTSGSFGTKQTDSYLNHNHSATSSTTGAHTHGYSGVTATNAAALGSATNFDTYTSSTTTSAGNHSHVITVNSSTSGGTETRPRNIAMRYLIKT